MPQDGIGSVVALIASAGPTLLIKMFTSNSSALVEAAKARAERRRGC